MSGSTAGPIVPFANRGLRPADGPVAAAPTRRAGARTGSFWRLGSHWVDVLHRDSAQHAHCESGEHPLDAALMPMQVSGLRTAPATLARATMTVVPKKCFSPQRPAGE